MTCNWNELEAELAAWEQAGLTLPLWWRDDDAVAPTPQLTRMMALAADLGLPVHLAVIPAQAQPQLVDVIVGDPLVIPVVHGWSHQNHASPDAKKCEFGNDRSLAALEDDARRGLVKLTAMFGTALSPMFVPPWNRLNPRLPNRLAALGYSMLSTFTPRQADMAAPGLAQINTHVDPINWKGARKLVDPTDLRALVLRQLQDRRSGRADNAEPYGILTHHLVQDDATWEFTRQLMLRLLNGPARAWPAQPSQTQRTL